MKPEMRTSDEREGHRTYLAFREAVRKMDGWGGTEG